MHRDTDTTTRSSPSSTPGLRQVTADLWETSVDQPAPGLTTHAYLWTPPDAGNVLFYSVATDRDLDDVARLGGVAHQYLSHRDEAGPMLVELQRRFDCRLHAPALEAHQIAPHRRPEVLFEAHEHDPNGVEILPTPGHSPGSTCFVVDGAEGRYLFVGDTMYPIGDGHWAAGYLPGISDADALGTSLDRLAEVEPDVAISSAFAGDAGSHQMQRGEWRRHVDDARRGLPGA